MKKFLLYISIFLFIHSVSSYAQVILEENFDYPTGLLYQVSDGKWKRSVNNDSKVMEGNLFYSGYSIGKGNHIYSEGSSSKGTISRSLELSYRNVIYVSFLMRVKDTLNLAEFSGPNGTSPGSSFFYLQSSTGTSKGFINIKKSNVAGNVRLGIYKTSSTKIIFSEYDVPVSTTILVILKYIFKPGYNDDLLSLWINPPDSKEEPVPLLTTGLSETDFDHIDSISLKQSALGGNLFIDAILTWTKWGDTPLPVELTSFTAAFINNKVALNWKTETEIDNYGFEIERKINDKNAEWKELAFIPGNGNSNSPKYYSYNDNSVKNLVEYCYRLKQIDNDGSFTYSYEVAVDVNIPEDFQLYQNYPNPFNPVTSIKFFLPEDGFTKLVLYNVIGEKTADLIQENLAAGEHEFNLDGSYLNSGVYLCTLESGGRKRTIKITLIK